MLVATHDIHLIERFGVRRVLIEGGRAVGAASAAMPLPSIVADSS